MELDHALRYLGNFGRYQTILYILLNIIICLFASMQLMGMVYISNTPSSFHCTPPSGFYVNETVPVHEKNGKLTLDSCLMYEMKDGEVTENLTDCKHGWDYETVHGETSVVTDFDLVCDKAILAKTAQALFMTGVLVGSVTSGQLADIFGRKIILFISLVCEALSGLGMALARNYYLLVFFWFLIGIFQQGIHNCGFVMIMEMFAPEKQTLAGSVYNMIWSACILLVTPVAFGLSNWRHYQLFASLICLLALPAWWFVPESMRWLISRGRAKEAEQILTTIADFNKIPVPQPSFLAKRPQELREEVVPLRTPHPKDAIYKPKPIPAPRKMVGQRHSSKSGLSKHQSSTRIHRAHSQLTPEPDIGPSEIHTFMDIFKSKVLLINFFIMAFCWYTASILYYGLSLHSSDLAGNLYFNVFLQCLVEFPATILIYFMLKWIGRRFSLSTSLLLAGIACIVAGCLPEQTSDGKDLTAAIITTATIGKFCIAASFGILYVFTPEIFPTVIRNVCLGWCSFFARIGGIIAPFVLYLDHVSKYLPMNIFGVISIVAGIICLFLPETRHRPLPETIDDCKRQGHSAIFSRRQRFESVNSQSSDKVNPGTI